MRDFPSLGLWPFPDAIFYLFVGELVENYWGQLVGSRQLRMLTWFSVIWSLFQFLVIIDYFLGKKHIESTMLCYTLAKHERFASQGLWPFPDDLFNFFVGEILENNWGKTDGVLVV